MRTIKNPIPAHYTSWLIGFSTTVSRITKNINQGILFMPHMGIALEMLWPEMEYSVNPNCWLFLRYCINLEIVEVENAKISSSPISVPCPPIDNFWSQMAQTWYSATSLVPCQYQLNGIWSFENKLRCCGRSQIAIIIYWSVSDSIYIYIDIRICYPQKKYVVCSFCMQQPWECACRSAKQRSDALMFHKSQQSLDIDRVQVWNSKADGSCETCWILRRGIVKFCSIWSPVLFPLFEAFEKMLGHVPGTNKEDWSVWTEITGPTACVKKIVVSFCRNMALEKNVIYYTVL